MSKGVPIVAAGGLLGYTPQVIQKWMHLGLNAKAPKKSGKDVPSVIEYGGMDRDWKEYYSHVLNCMALAQHVLKKEALLVGRLVQRLWNDSRINPDTMKFLFKQYAHVHGIRENAEQTVTVQGPKDEEGQPTKPTLVLYLPHNGREEPVVPLGKKS